MSRRLCPVQINSRQAFVVFSIALLSPDSVDICCRKLSVAPYQGAARRGCPARTGKSEAEHNNKAEVSLTRVSQHPNKVSREALARVSSCNPGSKSLIKFLMMKQVQGQSGEVIRIKYIVLGQTQVSASSQVCRTHRPRQEVRPQIRIKVWLNGMSL